MDLRALIFLWLHKPEVYGSNETNNTCRLRQGQFHAELEELFGFNSGWNTQTWGNPYKLLDAWLDMDRAVNKMDGYHQIAMYLYVLRVREYGHQWEYWPCPPSILEDYFADFFK